MVSSRMTMSVKVPPMSTPIRNPRPTAPSILVELIAIPRLPVSMTSAGLPDFPHLLNCLSFNPRQRLLVQLWVARRQYAIT